MIILYIVAFASAHIFMEEKLSKSDLDELLKTSECPVCLEQRKDNRILIPCGHSICIECLHVYLTKEKNNPLCPECKQKFQLFPKASEFPKDFRKNQLVGFLKEKFKSQQTVEIPAKDIMCDECETRLAVIKCSVCKVALCLEDEKSMHSAKAFQNHLRVPIQTKPNALESV